MSARTHAAPSASANARRRAASGVCNERRRRNVGDGQKNRQRRMQRVKKKRNLGATADKRAHSCVQTRRQNVQ